MVPFLNDVLAYWDQNGLPQDGTVFINKKEWSRQDIVDLRDKFTPYDSQIKTLERELEKLQDARVATSAEINELGVGFLSAMKGRFGASSDEAKNCPVVSKRRSSNGRASG